MSKLELCLFCKGEGKTCEIHDSGGVYTHAVVCTDCGASGPLGKSKEDAEQLWNTRYEMTCMLEHADGGGYYCSNCHAWMRTYIWCDATTEHLAWHCPACRAKVVSA